MQATAINNLKKAKGVDLSRESTPQGSGKGDLLQVMEIYHFFHSIILLGRDFCSIFLE